MKCSVEINQIISSQSERMYCLGFAVVTYCIMPYQVVILLVLYTPWFLSWSTSRVLSQLKYPNWPTIRIPSLLLRKFVFISDTEKTAMGRTTTWIKLPSSIQIKHTIHFLKLIMSFRPLTVLLKSPLPHALAEPETCLRWWQISAECWNSRQPEMCMEDHVMHRIGPGLRRVKINLL